MIDKCEAKNCHSAKAMWATKYCPAHSVLALIEHNRRIATWGQGEYAKGKLELEKFKDGFDVSYNFPRFHSLSPAEKNTVLKALPKSDAKVLADLEKTPAKFATLQATREQAKQASKSLPLEFTPDQIELVKSLLSKIEHRAIRVASR